MNKLKVCGVKIRTKPIKDIRWLISSSDHLFKGNLLMKPCFSYKRCHAQALSLTGNFNYTSMGKTTQHASSNPADSWSPLTITSLFRYWIDQIVEELLDLMLTGVEELIKEIKTGGILGCSDHALLEFVISRNKGLVRSRVGTLNFRRLNIRLFKNTWFTGDEWSNLLVIRHQGSAKDHEP